MNAFSNKRVSKRILRCNKSLKLIINFWGYFTMWFLRIASTKEEKLLLNSNNPKSHWRVTFIMTSMSELVKKNSANSSKTIRIGPKNPLSIWTLKMRQDSSFHSSIWTYRLPRLPTDSEVSSNPSNGWGSSGCCSERGRPKFLRWGSKTRPTGGMLEETWACPSSSWSTKSSSGWAGKGLCTKSAAGAYWPTRWAWARQWWSFPWSWRTRAARISSSCRRLCWANGRVRLESSRHTFVFINAHKTNYLSK